MYFILNNWTEIWESAEIGTRIESKNYPGGVFKTDEGYEFQLWIYPKGISTKTRNNLIIYPVSVESQYDESNIWPISGKQFTIGIVEPGFLLFQLNHFIKR